MTKMLVLWSLFFLASSAHGTRPARVVNVIDLRRLSSKIECNVVIQGRFSAAGKNRPSNASLFPSRVGENCGSPSPMYRILEQEGESRERRDQLAQLARKVRDVLDAPVAGFAAGLIWSSALVRTD